MCGHCVLNKYIYIYIIYISIVSFHDKNNYFGSISLHFKLITLYLEDFDACQAYNYTSSENRSKKKKTKPGRKYIIIFAVVFFVIIIFEVFIKKLLHKLSELYKFHCNGRVVLILTEISNPF